MNSTRGFTLLEVLAALLFVGVVGGALASLFATSLRQQQRAARLEHAREWLQAEVALQFAHASSGECQSSATYQHHGWQCSVQLQAAGSLQHAHIVLADTTVVPTKIIGTVIAIAEPQ